MWWSWILTFFGVTWLWLIGSGRWWAWGLCVLNECLWIVFAISTKQYGFIVAGLAYGFIDARNMLAARRRHLEHLSNLTTTYDYPYTGH